MRISDWSSDVCSSDLRQFRSRDHPAHHRRPCADVPDRAEAVRLHGVDARASAEDEGASGQVQGRQAPPAAGDAEALSGRSEEHTSELQSLMRISYAVFCLKKTNNQRKVNDISTRMSNI